MQIAISAADKDRKDKNSYIISFTRIFLCLKDQSVSVLKFVKQNKAGNDKS
uniref:Uncharacterized protein n=1 Tax=uncultured Desulfobacterium sp. TaxID=201089 RepID=E1YI64_9BACT|nr:unknown protein [uncultured Desulfobacterium sp.]